MKHYPYAFISLIRFVHFENIFHKQFGIFLQSCKDDVMWISECNDW